MKNTEISSQTQRLRQQVMKLVRQISAGRVISYGALGRRCEPPISGYVCGRVLAQVLDDVPWWRVVARDGKLPISKRSSAVAQRQREQLEAENVKFDDQNRVALDYFEMENGEAPTPQ